MSSEKSFKFESVVLYLIFTEIILGGLGKLFGFPVRIGIFGIGFIYTIYYMLGQKIQLTRRAWMYIITLILYAGYGALIGLIRGNNISYIIGDANVFISVFYIIIFVALIKNDENKLEKLSRIFIIYSVALSFVVFVVFKWSYFALQAGVDVIQVLLNFEYKVNYGFITGLLYSNTYARVYTTNGIFMQIALALCLIRLAYKNKFKLISFENISILLLTMGIIASGTRGYWIGTTVIVLMLVFFIRGTKITVLLSNLLIVVIGLVIAFSTFHKTDGKGVNPPIATQMIERAQSSTDFSNQEISNSVRNIQARHLIKSIKKHPIIGSGFGSVLVEYEKETKFSGLNVELYYLELWFKTGTIGILVLLSGVIHIVYSAFKIGKYQCNEIQQRTLKGWVLGFLSAGISGVTNPYFAGAHGFFIPIFIIILLEYYDKVSKKVGITEILNTK